MNGRSNQLPGPGARAVLDAGVDWYPVSEEDAAFRSRRDAVILARRAQERRARARRQARARVLAGAAR